MKNKENKKHCKDCNCSEVVEKKVKTMQDGKEYYEEIQKKIENNDSDKNEKE